MQRPDSKSRSRVRPAVPRGLSTDSRIRAPPGVGVILDGPMDSSAVNLLSDLLEPPRPAFGYRRNMSSTSRVMTNNERLDEMENQLAFNSGAFEEQDEENLPTRHGPPWYRQPSPWWLIIGTFLAALAISSTLAPKVELYTKLVCQELRPEYDMIALQDSATKAIDYPTRFDTVTIPRPSEKCQADAGVHKAVATLGAAVTTVMGIFSCFTAGYWGQFSDRRGRTLLLAITVAGVLLTDLTMIVVARFGQNLPFGYRFIFIAPIIEGLLGGISTGGAAGHAYVADCTTPATRSRYFSLSMGLLFVGVAVGPTIGGLLISSTGDLLSVFYLAAAIHLFYLVSMLFIVPESLSKEEMSNNREAHAERVKLELVKEERGGSGTWYWCWIAIKRAFFFLKPLIVLLPRKRAGTLKGRHWNLTCLMISYGAVALIMGSYQSKFQYASYVFGWTSQQLGYWLSTIGVLRATHLVITLPLIMKTFNRQSFATPGGTPSSDISETSSIATSIVSNPNRPPHTPTFDLFVARASALIEILAYAGVALSTTPTIWIAATLSASLGSGFAPSVQALALELHREAEEEDALYGSEGGVLDGGQGTRGPQPSTSTSSSVATTAAKAIAASSSAGTVYGAMGVVQALCTQILGPQIYGWTFVVTLETWPQAIFWLSSGTTGVAFVGLMLIRLIDHRAQDTERGIGERRGEREPLLISE